MRKEKEQLKKTLFYAAQIDYDEYAAMNNYYPTPDEIANKAIDDFVDYIIKIISTHTEKEGNYCDTGDDMDWDCRSNCVDLAIKRLKKEE